MKQMKTKTKGLFRIVETSSELYIYFAEQLIYKKWKNTGQASKLFNNFGPPTELR